MRDWGHSFFSRAVDYLGLRKARAMRSLLAPISVGAIITCLAIIAQSQTAQALPSFARQTGQPCGTCHTDFPGLTPYGRKFKILGYTVGGGPFKTTPFTLFPQVREYKKDPLDLYADPNAAKLPTSADVSNDGAGQSKIWVPPISVMTILGYTHQQATPAPPCSPYPCNDVLTDAPSSFFYGGAITEHIGAFAQVTYSGLKVPSTTVPIDPYSTFQWSWDNTDVRYANTAHVAGLDVIFGITANNNPSVQDPWNTTPAWTFPYAVSTAPNFGGFGPATLIDSSLAAHVAGVGAYAFINDLLYLELTGYKTINWNTQTKLGVDPFGAGVISGVAPYWRVAFEPHWGNHWFEFGAYGMSAQLQQWDTSQADSNGFQIPVFIPGADRFTDTAFDAQYQYQGSNYWFTLRGTYIYEYQQLNATFNNPVAAGSSNPTNTLNTFRGLASLAYGNDNRFVFTAQYFNTWGSSDTTLFITNPGCACSPNTNGYIFEIAYTPFVSSRAPIWPWANMRIGLQYTYYNEFNGDTVFAHDNNLLFAYIWFAM